MFVGIARRIVSLWFPRLATDRVLRTYTINGPFVLTLEQNNANRIYCLNKQAQSAGLNRGMPYSDARAFCPDLQSRPADLIGNRKFLCALQRWAVKYCPWVGIEGEDGLVLDITGSAHLFGGEDELLADIRQNLSRARLSVQIGLADTRGAAWALAHYGAPKSNNIAKPNETLVALQDLPVAALRLPEETNIGLQRMGLRTIGALAKTKRAPLARRFEQYLLKRLDQALGDMPEEINPLSDPTHYAVRMTLPEPIGLSKDVMAAAERLLKKLCEKLKAKEMGARVLLLSLRRVDQDHQQAELRLARPLHEPKLILSLFERNIDKIDAGFGIDQIRLEATQVEARPVTQASYISTPHNDQLNDLASRIGTRIGLENVQRFLPVDSHIPERVFRLAPVAYSRPNGYWRSSHPRPVRLFSPEPIAASSPFPPQYFRWRRLALTTAQATGPERILPEWWYEDENWNSGLRDYWFVETRQGRRLWLFFTPQKPAWFVQGEFV